MKKIFMTLILSVLLAGSVFAFTEGKVISDVGIPSHVKHIEFWNGGTCIANINDADVVILIQKDTSFLSVTDGNTIQFYVYKITSKDKTVKIVDSEALTILYAE